MRQSAQATSKNVRVTVHAHSPSTTASHAQKVTVSITSAMCVAGF